MPLGPFGEILGTTGTLESLGPNTQKYKSKVTAPRNPKLVKQNVPDKYKMTPSKFLFDMSLTTEQKLANTHVMNIPLKTELLDMGDTSLQQFSKVNIDEPLFQPFPSEVYFQNFNPFEVYEVPLIFRNNDKVPRLIKISQENSPYFKIINPHDIGHKVGPGLPTTFKIQFKPDEKKDYKHELVCITEREKFVVPIRAIGARGILDFPDNIHFPSSYVKYSNTKTLLVRNIGNKEAKFSLKAKPPFSVTPDIGSLGVNEGLQVTVEFKPLQAMDYTGTLLLSYNTGEEVVIDLYGSAQDANIRLDKNSIRIENTYISMANQRTIVITNHSDLIAHFRWTQFATSDDEDQHKLLHQIELDREENSDTDRFLEECICDPMLRDKLSILSRTFQNRKKAVENDPLLFQDDIISIEPTEGDIWPNSNFEIIVVFKPREATSYTRTAYCDITGREDRLPLRIRGEGMGPKVDFSFDYLEMGNIFIGSKHTYEIVIANKGDIDAIYSVVHNNSIFSPCFAFNPAEGIVMPGGHQAIEVAFSSPYLGDFEETFCVQVDGQPRQCPIKFSGRVVGPTFHFDVPKLKFGTVAFGFLSSQVCHLINTSLVPMVFHLRVPSDGVNKSVFCIEDIETSPMDVGPSPASDPKEFEIIPSHGVIMAQSQIQVTVNLVPNTVRKYQVAIVVDVERVGEELISLPISARSQVPEISIPKQILNYGRCFIHYPYELCISLYNETDLDAKYEIFPQAENNFESSPISYRSPKPKGIITAHSTVDVPLVITANVLQDQEITCLVRIFGRSDPIPLTVMCVGEGPVVHLNQYSIDWGETQVLVDSERTLVMTNESFIPARFKANMLRPNTVFRVSPTEGEIPPEQTIELKVTVNLDDCVRFQDKLNISITDSQARQVPLQAFGKGTTIISDPQLGPILNLGPNFSNKILQKKFKLTNRGRRIQQLVWMTEGCMHSARVKREKGSRTNQINGKSKSSSTALDVNHPVFQLLPNRMELHPGESIDFTLEGYVDGPQIVSETIICHAIIGRVGGKIPIISVNIRAEFIEPLLNFSTKCAFFRIDKEMGQELIPQRKQLTMNNVSSLPLTVGLKLAYPFSMIIDDQRICDTTVCLQTGDVYDLVIEFDPMFKDDSYIRTIDEVLYVTYKEHPHVDYIALRGEVYFPNLEFEKKAVDFGCILNDTEVTRYINITNISPMSVHYHWSFLVGDVPTSVKKKTHFKIPELTDVDEKVNADADVSTDVDEKVNADADMSTENTKETMIRRTGTGNDERENQVTIEEPYLTQNADVDNEKKEESAVDDNRRNRDLNIDVDIPEKGQLDQEEKLNDEKEKNFVEEERRSRVISRMSLLENEEESLRCNKVLTALLEDSDDTVAIGVEEVFDILPLYGCLQPDETEQVTFTFYGHADILGEVQAICKVEDGPTYEIKLTGEASVVEYAFSNKTIDLGKELYDSLATSTLTLFNTGKVGFEFTAVNMDPALETQPIPGQLVMVPHSGFIKAFGEQKIEVRLIPGIPESFQKTFQIQVAHFKPDTITVSGEGVFPRVSLNLPRLGDDAGMYASLMKEARENLGRLIKEEHQKTVISLQEVSVEELEKVTSIAEVGLSIEEVMKGGPVQESENVSSAVKITDQSTKDKKESAEMSESLHEKPVDLEANKGDQPDKPSVVKSLNASVIEVIEPSELELQMEMERLTVRNFVLKHQEDSGPLSTTNSKGENALLPVSSDSTVFSSEPLSSSKIKPVLPGYLLDFGYVVLGTVRTHVVHATNTGWVPVSFKIDQHEMHAAGFRTELDRVRNLPGSPDNETLDFVITFDPRGANLPLGPVEVLAPINIVKGPMLTLCLRAYVTMPDMKISADVLEFGKVKCGECKVITVQLHNHQMVKCDWDSSILEDKKKIEKHVPMHLRRKKRREKKQPNNFEVLPPTGTLLSGQRINVQVKFMPTEEKLYEHRIPIRIAQSSQRINLLCYGQGLEPRLDFERALIEFTPILPHSSGDEQTVVIGNPCPFPIEFYSLEFDPTYLFEERVLRLMRGYDEYNTLLLPPRGVGEKLPQELLQYYDELFKKVKEEEQAKAEAQAEAERKEREEKEKEELAAAQLLASEKVEEPKKEEEKPKEKEKKEKKSHKKAIPSETTGETDKDAEGGIENLEDGIMKAQTESLMTSSSSVTQCLSFTEIPSKTSLPPSVSADDEIIKIENLMEEKMKASLASGPGVGELEITPVSAAIARCLGIDLTSEGKAAKNRRGIAIVLHGAPKSGKTSTAIALAKHYQAALLTIDGVVCDAIANGNTQAGLKARELCSLAARKLSEDQSNQETVDGEKKLTNFSVEAVAAHTQAGTTAGSASGSRKISIRQTAAVSGKSTFLASSAEGATASLIPSSPPPSAFPPQHLSISASIAGENGFISCILPEDLLVEILGDRLQLNDCYRGVVFDGLETLFSPSYLSTTLAVLKALNNRRFIYFCTLKLEYSALKEQEEKACRQKELEEREKEEKELMWLEEMDEDEYDALSEDEKNRVDNKRLALKKEKIKRDKEKAQKDKQERAAREELERKKEEERLKGRGRKHRASVDEKRDKDKRAQAGGKNHDQARKPEKIQERSESASSDHHGERRREKNRSKTANDHGGEEVKDSSDQLLMQRFQYFEAAQKDIQDLLEHWDRSTLQPCRPLTPSEKSEEEPKELPMSVKRGKVKDKIEKQKEQERLHHEKELAEKAAKGISEDARTVYSEHTEEEKKEEIGVPHIIVDCANKTFSVPAITKNDFLPSTSEVLDGLGLGPQGPPIPPPATFAVVPYPAKRRAPHISSTGASYVFVASSPDDPNIGLEQKEVEADMKDEEKSRGAKTPDTKTGRTSSESRVESKRSAERRKLLRHGSSMSPASEEAQTPAPEPESINTAGSLSQSDEKVPAKVLTHFRWMVPACGSITLKLKFTATEMGQFDQTLNFELVGTRRRYQIFCRGVCSFPTISKEPRLVFLNRKRSRKENEIVHKKYILATETFEFGPLLVGKSRESYREGKYPENMEDFTIVNTSPIEADVSFCFLSDSRAETFMLEPTSMILKPKESGKLTVWAYPRGPGHYEDAVVCCVRENPEPVLFKISCDGFRPELDLDKKVIQFDKVLLHRKDTKSIYLRNTTHLPVAWKLSGLDNLGDDVTVAAESGIVEPLSEYPLQAFFRAMKATPSSKKTIRIEISDADYILGVVHAESIQIIVEAYDVALDMSFPKGTDGGLDFGTVKVSEEVKQICALKNKGKYEIAFEFLLESVSPKKTEFAELFTVSPSSGKLNPSDRPTQVQVIFRSSREVSIKDLPILKCQVIEPSLGEQGETIASIPVKVSVKAVFSKFSITPSYDLNFGTLVVGSRKTRTFTIENNGEFDFKYLIFKSSSPSPDGIKSNRDDKKSFLEATLGAGAKPKKESMKVDARNMDSKLTLGMFTIYPVFGIILPKGNQVITVDCVAENTGKDLQDIHIEINDRDPSTNKGGVPYQLMAEACIPSIDINDIGSIFEEHRVCKNLSVWQHVNRGQSEIGGIYGEEEKKFVFNNVIVGRQAKARFRITNPNKVPCDVVLALKPIPQRGAPKSQDVFDLDPPRMQIANNSHMYATVTFTPTAMQSYSTMFEASVESMAANQPRGKSLIFEVSGEGNLPGITVTKPTLRNRRGQPLLLFKRLLIGRSESLPMELINESTLPSKVDIDLVDPDNCFLLKPTKETKSVIGDIDYDDAAQARKRPHTASLIVNIGENATFEVIYRPSAPQRSQANLKITVVDNEYEDSIIQMIGEGFQDDITLDNIGSAFISSDLEDEIAVLPDDDVPAAKPNLMRFGDCYVNESRTLSLTMTNHSKTDCIRFQWPDHPQFKFSPQVGHLHASCTKDIAVTFTSNVSVTYFECPMDCRVTKIIFDKPIDQVCDWDDKIQIVKWVDDLPPAPPSLRSGSKSSLLPVTASHPAKKKMTETEPEPSFREVANSTRTVELLISSVADFVRCSCEVTSIQFKDTLMFQTRVYSITVQNEGRVALDYSWHVVMDNLVSTVKQPVTYTSSTERPESRVDLVDVTYVPFMVDPAYGSIPAGKTAQCLVKFAPLDANDYQGKLICSIPHMDSDEVGPFIELRGRSLVPYCHFELEDSDYISSARRNPELRGPGGAPPGSILDPNTRVIEFNICGTGVKSYKEFGIVNPTSSDYSFQWVCDDAPDTKEPSRFHCVNRQGQIKSGSKFKVGFEFTSRELGIVESFWRFTIPDQPISLPFLLVGNTKEPDVCLDRSHLNFKSVLVGRGARETVFLTNNENTWFNFAFDEVTCHTEAYASHLIVEPLQGQISAKSSVPINIYFSPNFEKEVNFNLRCVVARKVTPLTLNVKAEGISMNCVLFLEDISGAKTQLSEKGVNQVDFGEVEVTELVMKNLLIVNCGKFTFDFTWDLIHTQTGTSMVNITPQSGSIKHGESHQCTLSYCPHKHKALKGCELQLKITNGPTYQLCLTGVGVIPSLHFSFLSHSFGSCFIHKTGAGLPTKKVVLQLRNKDKKQIGVDCLFEATNYLMYKFQSCVLAPGEKVNIPFTFCPRQAMKYHETVTFLINGVSRQNVEFFGSGSELKIEVIDPNQKCVNFGARMVGDSLRKFVPIVNRSPVPVTFNLAFTPNEPALQSFDALGVSPKEAITLSASGGTTKVEVLFRPKARIPQFTEEVLVECAGTFQPLFVVKGSCLGMEVSLDSDSISFGTVFQRSSSSRKLVMSNNGDMNTKFRWDIKHFKPDFSISPVEGYITPGMEVSFQIDFHPQNICADVRYEKLKCFLDGGPQKPITLTLTGSCTGIPPVKEVQHFQAVVRQSETKQIMIPNKSNQPWNLKPIIDGEYWTGPLTFTVEPQQTKAYELTYKPMTMTAEGKKHLGSIFFPLPDGSGLLFNLSGTADAPRAAGKIQREVPCKTSYTEVLTVTNWQKKLQRFHVKIESLRDKVDPGTTVKGAEYIDLPAKSKKDYKLSFFAYKEGQTFVKVTFTNEQSGEYQFYEVLFRATRPGTVATINLSTPVRQSVPYVITVENPLSYQVNFQITCSVAEVLIPNQLAVPPQSQGQFSFEFQPLKTGIVNGHLELNSTDLGLYLYELVLTATPGAPEKAIYFRTYLGSSVSQVAKFLNFAKVKTDYACKIASQDFHVEKMVAAAPASTGGTEVAIDVLFEPSALGEQHAKLLVASPVGGDYIIPLFGTCLSPKPQGPFSIKAGSSISIIFKNVFNTTTYFTFQVDNPLFHVAKQSESIRSNKEYRIVVSFDGADSHSKAAVMGKLIVSCLYSAGGTSNVQWMYYLKGV